MRERQQSTTSYPMSFLMTDSNDHISAKTGLAPTVTLSKNGAAFGAAAGAVTEIGNGWYKLAGNATDRDTLGPLLLHASATGADPYDGVYTIVPWDPFDANLALSRLDAAITSRAAAADYTAARAAKIDNLDATVSSRSTLTAANVWDALLTGITTASSIGKLIKDNLDATISSRLASGNVTVGTNLDKSGYSLSAAGVQAIWDALTSALTVANSVGKRIADNLDAAVSSRSSHTAADVWASATRTLSAFAFSVTVGTNNDKSGYSLSAAGVQAIWDALTSALTTVGSVGKRIVDQLDATVSSRADGAQYTTARAAKLDNLDAAVSTRSSHSAADVWAVGSRTLTAFGFAVDLSSAAVQAIWDKATTALTVAGSIGKRLADDVDAAISSRLPTSSYTAPDNATISSIYGAVDTEVAAIKAKTDNLPASPAAVSDIPTAGAIAAAVWAAGSRTLTGFGTLAADVWAAATRTLTSFGSLPASVSTQVWSEPLPGSFASGSAGQKLNAAGSAADPLTNQVPGTYAGGTAGAALGRIGTAAITTVAPLSADGTVMTIRRGDDYVLANARAFQWSASWWPDLTGATIAYSAVAGGGVARIDAAGSVVVATGAVKTVRVELPHAKTLADAGSYTFDVQATWPSGDPDVEDLIVTLVSGALTVGQDVAA